MKKSVKERNKICGTKMESPAAQTCAAGWKTKGSVGHNDAAVIGIYRADAMGLTDEDFPEQTFFLE